MGAAAIPIGMGVSAIAGAVGSAKSAKASQPRAVPVPPPNALFPGMQNSYLNDLTASGVQPQSFGTISEAARTGLPVDQGNFFDALKSSMGRSQDEGRANLIEKYGFMGLRSSTPLMNAAVDYESQTTKDFATIMADYTRQAGESAANRRLQASTLGVGLAGEPALAMTPSAVVSSGGQSALGNALGSGASSLQNLMMMRMLFPNIFGGGGGSGSGAGGTDKF
jgi:hypothetical protein